MLKGRTALVTGSTRGIGEAAARTLAAQGCNVMMNGFGDADDIEGKRSQIEADSGSTVRYHDADLSDEKQLDDLVDSTEAAFGRIDILVNNAGISRFSAIDSETYEDDWAISLEVLLTAHTRTIRAALPFLRESDAARIVNVSSTEGWGATKFGSPYTAAKHGVIGLTKSLAVELGREGITVNCICPGPIDTAMTSDISVEHKAIFAKRRTALGRYAQPEEVAHGTLNFCLPSSQYITGAILPVDGGLLIKNA